MASAVSITVGGVSKSVLFAGFSIKHQLGGRDTARIRLLNERPAVRSTLNITVDGVLRFGGVIINATESGPITRNGVTAYVCDVDAVGWDLYLDTVIHNGDRPSETLAARLAVLHGRVSSAPFSLTLDVQAGSPTLPAQAYGNYRSLSDIYRELATQAQWTYRVTPGKVVTWRPASGAPACPFNVNLSGGAKPIGETQVKTSAAGYANKVWVIAGDAGSEIYAEAHNQTEIDNYGLCEITVGAPAIKDQGAAQALADSTLSWRCTRPQDVEVSVQDAGAWPGMSTTITLAARNLSASFLIQSVDVRALTPGDIVYTLGCSSYAFAQSSYLDTYRSWSGGSTQVLSSIVGSGGGGGMAVYTLGGSDFVGNANTDGATYVVAPNAVRLRLDGSVWSGRTVTAVVWVKGDAAGTGVTPEIWNLTTNTRASASGTKMTGTNWQVQVISVTIVSGQNDYVLRFAVDQANVQGYAYGYLELR